MSLVVEEKQNTWVKAAPHTPAVSALFLRISNISPVIYIIQAQNPTAVENSGFCNFLPFFPQCCGFARKTI